MTPQLDLLVRAMADERKAQLRQLDRVAWMREDGEADFANRPVRPAGVVAAILALVIVGQMFLI
jgi:hypothetical protein